MAKSKIIKDLANGTISTHTALMRTKVLLQEFDNDSLLDWVNCEIEGYPDSAQLPKYRRIKGVLRGSYFEGSIAVHIKYTDVSLPLGTLTTEQKDAILTTNITQGIEALKELISKNGEGRESEIAKPIPADFFGLIALANNNMGMIIQSARVVLSTPDLYGIFPRVESKLIDILSYLEKQFGNLDDLDIDITSKSQEDIEGISDHIHMIIYNDFSVTIGDKNKINGSEIASSIKEE